MRIRWRGLELPSRVACLRDKLTDSFGEFHVEPFERVGPELPGAHERRAHAEELGGADVGLGVVADEPRQLGLRAEGERFTITFDGKPLFTATDRTFAGAGKVALWTKADSVTRFDRIEIKPLP